MTDNLGLYLHIPFCERKCRYCDFYSSFVTEELLDKYTVGLLNSLKKWGGLISRPIDTIYLGGGTPSLLAHRLPEVIKAVSSSFNVLPDTEITLELNPASNSEKLLGYAKEAGVNRLSIGAQSGRDCELKALGRTHSAKDTENTVKLARSLGFDNISLDIMLGLPDSNNLTLTESLQFIKKLGPEHISAYILKIEERTAFYNEQDSLNLPDSDLCAEQYLLMCDFFEGCGYKHYEISNFCKENKESRHNLKYWKGAEYLGIGPAAHSFIDGKRFYYPSDLKAFISGNEPSPDGFGGDKEEYIMLRLRLSSGVSPDLFKQKFKEELPKTFYDKCNLFQKTGLINITENRISLTNEGMLLSNSIISELLECI